MLVKLAIIGAILLGGVIIFSNEINQVIPETLANQFDSIKNDLGKFKDETVQKTETNVGNAVDVVSNEVKDFTERSTEQLSENITDLTESTQEVIFFGMIKNNENENLKSTPIHNSGSSPTSVSTTTQTQTFETLSLKTIQQAGDNVMLHYEDTSGKTISVTVTLRTDDRELFSGTFYTSMFETIVNDASNASYFIDMVVEHEEYGTISSSVFNSGETPETTISGVFSQS